MKYTLALLVLVSSSEAIRFQKPLDEKATPFDAPAYKKDDYTLDGYDHHFNREWEKNNESHKDSRDSVGNTAYSRNDTMPTYQSAPVNGRMSRIV